MFVYELLDGKAPFRNNNRVALADSILAGIDPVLKVSYLLLQLVAIQYESKNIKKCKRIALALYLCIYVLYSPGENNHTKKTNNNTFIIT